MGEDQLFKALVQAITFSTLSPSMETMLVAGRIILEFVLVDDWKQFMIEAGVVNSLVVLIADPNKVSTHKTVKPDMIINTALLSL